MLAAASSSAQNIFTAEKVGTAVTQTVTVTATTAGTVSYETVVTLGQTGLDFTLPATPAFTCTGTAPGVNGTCNQSVTFTPKAPGLRLGAVELFDVGGDLLGETLISGTGTGGLAVLVPGNTLPFAGDGSYLDAVVDNIPALTAELYSPTSVAIDGAGNLYIADSEHNRIRMVSAATGEISTVAGTGTASYTGDGLAATAATLRTPSGIAIDGAGNLYIADTGNNAIRKVNAVTHDISTVAGLEPGTAGYGGDGTGATTTGVLLDAPQGVAVDAAGDIYIADTNNQVVREVSATTLDIETIAGEYYGPFGNGVGGYNGDGALATALTLNQPYAVAVDPAGDVLIADTGNNRIREINATTLKISTVAGNGVAGETGDNALATEAELDGPAGIALDAAGDLYIGDTQNSSIRKVNAGSGYISTLAVSGEEYLLDTDSIANTVAVKGPQGLLVDSGGNVFFANTLDMEVWEIESNLAALDFTATPVRQGNVSTAALFQTVENDGNDAVNPLAFTSIAAGANAEIDTAIPSGTCATTASLAVDVECTIGVYFAPAATPVLTANTTETGTVSAAYTTETGVTGPNSPLAITAVGVASPLNSTTTTVSSSLDPSLYAESVTFTVTVTTGTGTGDLTGTVTIYDTFGGVKTTLATGLALTAGATTYTTTTLPVGANSITAAYSGDTEHGASTSTDDGVSPLSQIVEEATSIALTSSANPSLVGQSVTFTATVTAPDGGGVLPDGALSFVDGTTTLATVQLSGGVATYTTAALAAGAHSITAVYSGDDTKEILGETSAVLTQDVQATSTLVVATSGSPSYYGNTVTFTATITSAATTAASGTVKFYDAGALIGTGTLSGGTPDTAQFATSTLAVGTHSITATYAGDNFNSSATAIAISQVVDQTVTSDTVTATPNPGVQGTAETITDTVKVTSGAGTPTGTVTFTSGTTVLGTANLTAAGTATITPTLAPGTYSIVATYGGDTDDAGSASAAVPLTVDYSSTTAVTATPDPSLYQQSVTFTVQVTSGAGGAIPTGTVTLYDTLNGVKNTLAAGLALNATGAATFTTTTLAIGAHSITATYSGDTSHVASTSTDNGASAWSQVVEEQTSVALTSSVNPSAVGQSVTFTATVTALNGGTILPDGSVTFMDGTTTLATVTLSGGGVATYTTAALTSGAHPITAVYSGDANKEILGETSTVLTQDVQATATIVVTTSGTPSYYGAAVTFTATITSAATTPASGTVNFYDAGVLIGTGTLSGGTPDIAQFATATLAVGTHSITATYAGDNFNTAAASAVLSQVVAQTVTADTIAATPNPGVQGTAETITDTVKVTSGAGTPTGTVTFTSGTTVLGTATLNASGVATITPTLAPGTYSIVATYGGDTDDGSSQSSALSLTVENSSTTAVTATPNPSLFNQSVTITVQVTSGTGGAIPTGTVTLYDTLNGVKNTLAAGLALNTSGAATFTTTTLAIGLHSITASYSGDTTHEASTSTDNGALAWSQVVEEQTSVALTSSVDPSQVGQSVTFTATVTALNGGTVTPDGEVTFMDGTTTLASVQLSGGVATYTTAALANGLHPITAIYSGDANKEILGETSAVLDQIVQAQATIAVATSGTPSYYGAAVTFTATVASSATTPATGTVNFYDAGVRIGSGTLTGGSPDIAQFTTSALAVGTHSITVNYAGDNYNTAATSAAITQVVTQTVTAVAVIASPNPGIAGAAETLTATVTVTKGGGTPTGVVTFLNGTTVLGAANLNTSGVATISPVLAPGTYSIVASYAGDTDDASSQSSALSLTVNQATTTTTLTVSPNPSTYLSPVTFTAVVAGNGAIPTGTVQFFAGTTLIGAGTLNTSGVTTITFSDLAIGTYAITAVYEGDTNDAPSTSAAVSLTVGKIPTTTDLGSTTTGGSNPQVDLVATVVGSVGPVPTGTVTFTDASTTLGTATLDANGVATLVLNLTSGTYAVYAVYSGDTYHLASTSQPITVAVAPVTFSMTISPTTLSLKTTQYGEVGIVMNSENGFADTIDLGCLGLPAGVTCHFSSPDVKLASNGSAIAQLTIDTNSPLTGGSEAMNRRAGGGAMLAGVLLPFGVLFGWIFRRQRKRMAAVFTMVLLIALSAVALMTTGCNGISSSSAAPGTYTIEVVGSGTTTGVTVNQDITVTITQ
ncbi:MAG: Ig-like domain repeat protein [Terracidiphilus sp.]